jgi:hypothetical protein
VAVHSDSAQTALGKVDGDRRDGSRSTYGKSKAEAQAKLRAALLGADNGIRPPDGRLTVGRWLDEWLNTTAMRLRPRTVKSYVETCDRYVRPALGSIPLAKLEPSDVQRMLSRLEARGDLSPTTCRYAYAVLRIALGRALKSGKVLRNVATLVDPPARARRELRPCRPSR